jgi:hypothetical protein
LYIFAQKNCFAGLLRFYFSVFLALFFPYTPPTSFLAHGARKEKEGGNRKQREVSRELWKDRQHRKIRQNFFYIHLLKINDAYKNRIFVAIATLLFSREALLAPCSFLAS